MADEQTLVTSESRLMKSSTGRSVRGQSFRWFWESHPPWRLLRRCYWRFQSWASWLGRSLRGKSRPRAQNLTGRRAAVWGLALSVCFGVGAVTDRIATRWRLESEATELTMAWLDHLQHGRVEAAHQLTLVPWRRRAGSDLAEYYKSQPEARHRSRSFHGRKANSRGPRARKKRYRKRAANGIHRNRHPWTNPCRAALRA